MQPTARDRLLAAAVERTLTDGIDSLTARLVCTEAAATMGSLYHHFTSMDGLVDAVVESVIARWGDDFIRLLDASPDPRAGLTKAFRFHGRWLEEQPRLGRVLLQASGRGLPESITTPFGRGLARWTTHHGLGDGVSPIVVSAAMLGPLIEVTRLTVVVGLRPSPKELSQLARSVHAGLESLRGAQGNGRAMRD